MHAAPFPEAQSTGSSAMVQSWPSCRHSNLLSSSALNFNFTKSEGTLTTHLATSSLQQRSFNFLSWGTATNRKKNPSRSRASVDFFGDTCSADGPRSEFERKKRAHWGDKAENELCTSAFFDPLFQKCSENNMLCIFPKRALKKMSCACFATGFCVIGPHPIMSQWLT